MSASYKPAKYNSLSPYLIVQNGSDAIDFMVKVFNGTELRRIPRDNGTLKHAEVLIDDTVVMLGECCRDWPPVPTHIHLYVKDVDDSFKRALEFGADAVQEPVKEESDEDKRGGVKDRFGTTWWISTKVE